MARDRLMPLQLLSCCLLSYCCLCLITLFASFWRVGATSSVVAKIAAAAAAGYLLLPSSQLLFSCCKLLLIPAVVFVLTPPANCSRMLCQFVITLSSMSQIYFHLYCSFGNSLFYIVLFINGISL